MGPFDIAMMGVFTGLIFVVGSLVVILLIVMAQIRYRRRRAEMLHQERMMALEKGITLPMDSLDVPRKRRPYFRGLVFSAVGLGIVVMGSLGADTDLIGIGSIFLLVGIALLVGDWITARQAIKKSDMSSLPGIESGYRSPENPT
jgi:hypothetical protein